MLPEGDLSMKETYQAKPTAPDDSVSWDLNVIGGLRNLQLTFLGPCEKPSVLTGIRLAPIQMLSLSEPTALEKLQTLRSKLIAHS